MKYLLFMMVIAVAIIITIICIAIIKHQYAKCREELEAIRCGIILLKASQDRSK